MRIDFFQYLREGVNELLAGSGHFAFEFGEQFGGGHRFPHQISANGLLSDFGIATNDIIKMQRTNTIIGVGLTYSLLPDTTMPENEVGGGVLCLAFLVGVTVVLLLFSEPPSELESIGNDVILCLFGFEDEFPPNRVGTLGDSGREPDRLLLPIKFFNFEGFWFESE